MSVADQTQSPEEIERQIEATRRHMSATLNALQDKLEPGDLMEAVWSYLRGNSSDMGKSLMETVRENPVPVALIGVGVSWLMVGGSSGSRHSAAYREDYDALQYGEDLGYEGGVAGGYPSGAVGYSGERQSGRTGKAKEKWQSAKEKVSATAAKVKGRTSEMADNISNRTKDKMGQVSERAHEMKDRMSEKMHSSADGSDTSHRASEKYQQMADRSQEMYQRSMDRASRMGHGMRARYSQQKYRARSMLQEHPLAMAAIGIGVGAFLGALLPTSRREQDLMRQTGGQMSHTLMEAGREQFERVRGMAEQAAHNVREQAEQVRHSDESMGEKASRVAGAARQEGGSEAHEAMREAHEARREAQEAKREAQDRVGTPPQNTQPRKPITPPL